MMWKIDKIGNFTYYTSDDESLRIKVNSSNEKIIFLVNYKGYNIIFPMEVWGVGQDRDEWGIDVEIHGDVKQNASEIYYTLEKGNERKLADLVYFFVHEVEADGMISRELKILNW